MPNLGDNRHRCSQYHHRLRPNHKHHQLNLHQDLLVQDLKCLGNCRVDRRIHRSLHRYPSIHLLRRHFLRLKSNRQDLSGMRQDGHRPYHHHRRNLQLSLGNHRCHDRLMLNWSTQLLLEHRYRDRLRFHRYRHHHRKHHQTCRIQSWPDRGWLRVDNCQFRQGFRQHPDRFHNAIRLHLAHRLL